MFDNLSMIHQRAVDEGKPRGIGENSHMAKRVLWLSSTAVRSHHRRWIYSIVRDYIENYPRRNLPCAYRAYLALPKYLQVKPKDFAYPVCLRYQNYRSQCGNCCVENFAGCAKIRGGGGSPKIERHPGYSWRGCAVGRGGATVGTVSIRSGC